MPGPIRLLAFSACCLVLAGCTSSDHLRGPENVGSPRPDNGTAGSQTGAPLFSGPDLLVGQGGGLYYQALVRQQNCSVTNVFEELSGLSYPFTGTEGQTIPNYEAYMHKLAMMPSTGDVFANGCADPSSFGVSSPQAVVLGATQGGSATLAALLNGNIYVGKSNATGNLSLATEVSAPGATQMLADSFASSTNNLAVLLTPSGSQQSQLQMYAASLGNSSLTPGASVTLPSFAQTMVSGAFTSSGHKDIVITGTSASTLYGSSSGSLIFLKGSGSAKFAAPVATSTGSVVRFVERAADVNGDGKLDILAIDYDTTHYTYELDVLLGNGDGTFTTHPSIALPGLGGIALGDFDDDGDDDLAIYEPGASEMIILKGDGTGNFTDEERMPAIGAFQAYGQPYITDVDGDGNEDIVIGTSSSGYFGPSVDTYNGAYMQVFLGHGDLTFSSPAYVSAPVSATLPGGQNTFAVGDINGDNQQDFATLAGGNSPSVLTYLNKNGAFSPGVATQFNVSGGAALAMADLNGDGKSDVIAAGSNDFDGNYAVQAGLGSSTGQLFIKNALDLPAPVSSMAAASLTGSGHVDLAAVLNDYANGGNNGLYILPGNGDGTFGMPMLLDPNLTNGVFVTTADFNGDGLPDIAAVQANGFGQYNTAPSQVRVYIHKGSGGFAAPISFYTRNQDTFTSLVVGDFTGDGVLDMGIVGSAYAPSAGYTQTNFYTYLGDKKGNFTYLTSTPLPQGSVSAVAADFTGDQKLDVMVDAPSLYSAPTFLLGSGTGSFTAGSMIVPRNVSGLAVISINGDKYPDVLLGPGAGGTSVAAPGFAPLINHFGNGVSVPMSATSTTITQQSASEYPGFLYIAVTVAETNGGTGIPTGPVSLVAGNLSYTGTLLTAGNYTGQVGLLPGLARLTPGSYTGTITYQGDLYNKSSSTPVSFTVPYITTTTVTTPGAAHVGDNVTIGAMVQRAGASTHPGGSVTFTSGSMTLATLPLTNGSASFTASTKGYPAGTYPILATYNPDTEDSGSTSMLTNLALVPATLDGTTTAVFIQPLSPTEGQSATLSVEVEGPIKTPTGSVSLSANGVNYGSVPLSPSSNEIGEAALTFSTAGLTPGTYNVVAQYSGSSTAYRSVGNLPVIIRYPTLPQLTISNTHPKVGQDVVITFSLAHTNFNPTGTCTLYADGQAIDTFPASSPTQILHTGGLRQGTFGIELGYNGDTYNGPGLSSSVLVTLSAQ